MTLPDFMNLFDEFRASSGTAGAPSSRASRRPSASSTPSSAVAPGRVAHRRRCSPAASQSREYPAPPASSSTSASSRPTASKPASRSATSSACCAACPRSRRSSSAESKDSIELTNGVIIEVITASIAAPRGRAYALVIVEEAAFLPTDTSANPDVELLRAVRPALARVPGSLLVVVSRPYARRGVIWHAWQKHHDSPTATSCSCRPTRSTLNPTFDRRAIETAYAEDPASAAAEYGAQFRSDVEIVRRPRSHRRKHRRRPARAAARLDAHYEAVADPSGGIGADCFTSASAIANSAAG